MSATESKHPGETASPPSVACKLRILLIAPSMDIVGGHSVQADRLLRGFSGDKHIVLEFCPINPRIPVFVWRIPYLRTFANMLVYYTRLFRGILRSDLVHVFTASFWGYTLWTIPAICLSRIFKRNVIVNYHDGRAEQHLRMWRSAIPTMRWADRIIVPSTYLQQVFQSFGLPSDVIPNAIDTAAYRFRERRPPRPDFLTNRGMEPLYNIECTLRAFRLIQDRYPESRFVIANDGPLRPSLEALANNLKLRNATFTGAVSQERMAELYDDAGVYVMSPLIDNMPLTVIECFAAGLPVVSTGSGGIPHISEHGRNALLVMEASPVEIANACFRLLEEQGLAAQLAAAAHEDCVNRYSLRAVVQLWRETYQAVTGVSV